MGNRYQHGPVNGVKPEIGIRAERTESAAAKGITAPWEPLPGSSFARLPA